MINQTIEKTQIVSAEAYQMIKDEHLASVVVAHQSLAGSRILMSTYRHVVFSECSFYACEFQGVTFENCVFENCNFEFSHIRNCKFLNCSFNDCTWTACSSTISVYEICTLDLPLKKMTTGMENDVIHAENSNTTDIYIENLLAA